MTSKHHGRQHLRLINNPSEPGAYRREDAPDTAMGVLMTPTTEDLAPGRPHLFAVRQLEQGHDEAPEALEEPDFTQGSVEGSLNDLLAAAKQDEHLTRANFEDSNFMAARRRRAAEKAGRALGVANEPVDLAQPGVDTPTEQFPPIPHWPDDAS